MTRLVQLGLFPPPQSRTHFPIFPSRDICCAHTFCLSRFSPPRRAPTSQFFYSVFFFSACVCVCVQRPHTLLCFISTHMQNRKQSPPPNRPNHPNLFAALAHEVYTTLVRRRRRPKSLSSPFRRPHNLLHKKILTNIHTHTPYDMAATCSRLLAGSTLRTFIATPSNVCASSRKCILLFVFIQFALAARKLHICKHPRRSHIWGRT